MAHLLAQQILMDIVILCLCSTFDEYALEYVAEVLKESADLDGSFDVDSFIAVLAGYLPQLEEVDR